MNKIALVTDSTANLPAGDLSGVDLYVVPLNIHWGKDTFLDGEGMSVNEFYTRLAKDPEVPKTSQPSMKAFLDKFNEIAATGKYEGILSILISSGISGTVASALSAKQEFNALPLEVIDSKTTTGGLALAVNEAARVIGNGASLSETAEHIRSTTNKMKTYFAVDTLKYLHKGGRIGGASRLLGTLLNFKPILFLDSEGKVDALERVRTRKKVVERMLNIAEEISKGKPSNVAVFHAEDKAIADEFSTMLREKISPQELYIWDLSPVIGTHTGPGTFGMSIYTV